MTKKKKKLYLPAIETIRTIFITFTDNIFMICLFIFVFVNHLPNI